MSQTTKTLLIVGAVVVALYVLSPKAATLATPGVTTRVGGALNYAPTTIGGTPGDAATRTTTTSRPAFLRNG